MQKTQKIWQNLQSYHQKIKMRPIIELFANDKQRFTNNTAHTADLLLDYSKTNIDAQTKILLLKLIEQSKVMQKREAMFSGKKINSTEKRSVLHTALRNLSGEAIIVDGYNIMLDILACFKRMQYFCDDVHRGVLTGIGGHAFRDVVNIGIGGSDLGAAMVTRALSPYHCRLRAHFISNVDAADISDCLQKLDASTTLIIVASKTFTTIETMTNARTAAVWLRKNLGQDDISDHLVAISNASKKVIDFGVKPQFIFNFGDWIGGRYSIWGPIGLPVMLMIGADNFRQFLFGAQTMDRHFRTAALENNLPILLAMVGIWHNNICAYSSRAIIPYEQRLSRLPAYLQQLDMESNGKGVNILGERLVYDSGPIVWGDVGTNAQHAFFQLIHQGTRVIPCEFLLAKAGHETDLVNHHRLLQANCLAQSEALMLGQSKWETQKLLAQKGMQATELNYQSTHRAFRGNRPSITLVYPKLTPYVLGQIIALYEHRVFVEGVIWGINSFDQWGVEMGKNLANEMLDFLDGNHNYTDKNSSTQGLLNAIKS